MHSYIHRRQVSGCRTMKFKKLVYSFQSSIMSRKSANKCKFIKYKFCKVDFKVPQLSKINIKMMCLSTFHKLYIKTITKCLAHQQRLRA